MPHAVMPNTFEIANRGRDSQLDILSASCLRFVNLQVSQVDFLLAHPNAIQLIFERCFWDITAIIPESARAAVRSVRLEETGITDLGFNEILCKLPQLRSLVYYRPTEEIDTCFDGVGDELTKHGQGLEHLELWNGALMPFCTPIGSLCALTNLKTLEMDLELLIGFRDNPRGWDDYMDAGFYPDDEEPDYDEVDYYAGDWSLVKLLPPSLEKVKLLIELPKLQVYFNYYDRFGAKFEELLTDKEFANLREITAPRLNLVAEKLCGRGTGWKLDGTSKVTMVRVPSSIEAEPYDCDSVMTDTETFDEASFEV